MKNFIILTMFLFALASCKQGGGPGNVQLSTDQDKTVYTIGNMFGSRVKSLELNEHELTILYQGLYDAALGKPEQVEVAKYHAQVQTFFRDRMSKVTDQEKEKGTKFIEVFLKEPDTKKTESGLAYKILQEGAGANPKATDEVEVHYRGTLIDGTEFDSSLNKNKISFPLNRVIKGWTEGLQLIKAGGKIKLVIPSDLAYGDHGAPPKIPGGATLVFEVELFQIKAGQGEKMPELPKKIAPRPTVKTEVKAEATPAPEKK